MPRAAAGVSPSPGEGPPQGVGANLRAGNAGPLRVVTEPMGQLLAVEPAPLVVPDLAPLVGQGAQLLGHLERDGDLADTGLAFHGQLVILDAFDGDAGDLANAGAGI